MTKSVGKKRVLIALILVGLLLSSVVVIAYESSCNFVGSKNSDVYHYPDCRYAKNIKSGSLVCFDTPEDAIAAGYRACKVCKPPKSSPTATPTATPTPTPSPINWIEKTDTPATGGYGEAVVGTDDYLYIAKCMYASSAPYFWRYDPSADKWNDSMNVSSLPIGAFRNGTALAWDYESYIYALLGGRYNDINRRLFYRYDISNDSWEPLIDTPHTQGAGDALAWSGYDNRIYAIIGSKDHNTTFACYNASKKSWNTLNLTWNATDDGASLIWTGGEYLYALRGEWQETVPCQDFARYCIPNGTWEDLSHINGSEGVGVGASLLWAEKYPDYIFALSGGNCLGEPGYGFYRYNIASNKWKPLESIPCPVGYYVGNRLGFAKGYIYYWQGVPTTEKWICGGDAFYMLESNENGKNL